MRNYFILILFAFAFTTSSSFGQNEKESKDKPQGDDIYYNYIEESSPQPPENDMYKNGIDRSGNRNVFAIGYQIGGYTLIGIDHEIRFDDYFGIHYGAGLTGFTGGLKIHTNPAKNSSFFNMSYKDGGFGLISALGLEFGGRWVFNKEGEFGLHYQFGLAKILSIDEDFAEKLFKGKEAPGVMLSLGVGFSW